MTIDRLIREYEITYVFSLLSTNITFNSQQSKLDINRVMETVLADLLNKMYNASYFNLNKIKHNYPAIDLGDVATRSAIQVTSDGTVKKFKDTVDMFIKHKLQQDYDKITFLIISNGEKNSFSRKPFDIEVKNLSDIAKEICGLDTVLFDDIYNYCDSNFSAYFPKRNSSMLELTQLPSVDPSMKISHFLMANNINFGDEHIKCTEDDMRNQLISLKTKLSELTDDQRLFIYRTLDWTIEYYPRSSIESCCIPMSVITNASNNMDGKKLKSIVDSLEKIKLASYDESISEIDSEGFYVYYNNDIPEEFDYLAGIVTFLKKSEYENQRKEMLQKIILECNFSSIN